ncbi:MAG TPA: phospholipid carrier-dependent glycosyltransferase [Actinotalea sp.]|nr:phospholipid carrier-dependent glycosyltransferase [Actinotalea sp.]
MQPAGILHDDRGWAATAAVTAVAAALRLPGLGRPATLVFDETYYVKDAWTLLQLGYEAEWGADPNAAFEAGDTSGFGTDASYVVHPAVGKWLIALGLRLLGAGDPAGWRIASALAGVLAVLLLTRIARRLLGSTVLGAVAGLLLAVDGLAIVHSRTALLDGFLMVLVLAAFGALLVDRDRSRARLARATAPPRATTTWGPWLGWRPWRLAAGVLLGLALGTKWSALWFVAVLGLLTVGWDLAARYAAGVRRPWTGTLARDAWPAFLSLVPVAALTYLATWASWFASPDAYHRQWAVQHPGQGVTWLPPALRSLWHYHQEMWGFHTSLTAEHGYAAHPVGWLVQWRPTSFFYETPEPARDLCGADRCSQAVTSLGNPLLWWLGTAAVVACVWWVVRRRDGVAVAALSGLVAGWLPWFAYAHRTIFTFYAIVVLPWLILALVHAADRFVGHGPRAGTRRTVALMAFALVIATSVFFYPVWTAQVIPFRTWQLHQWLPSWV